jgi:glycine hydroxymethyltransferase
MTGVTKMAVYEPSLPSDVPELRLPGTERLATRGLSVAPAPTLVEERDFLSWLWGMLSLDRHYHMAMATLTASENYASRVVRAAAAFVGGEHYFFEPPFSGARGEGIGGGDTEEAASADGSGEWAFPTSAALPGLQNKFQQQMRALFGAQIADWRPNGGSACEQAVVMAACDRGDAFVQIAARDGGHFGTAELARQRGVEAFEFPMIADRIDVGRTLRLVEGNPHIRLLLIQPSHTRRPQPVEELARALSGRVTIAVDVSHTAGLIAGGVLPQPLAQGAHVLTFNTHKTLPGPNKGVIAFGDRNHPLAEKVWQAVCPTLQSNSHPECLPGLVLALEELAVHGRAYAQQTAANARALADALDEQGLHVAGMEYGGTETHQVHLVVGPAADSHAIANVRLPTCGIRTNSVMLPGTDGRFGLRLGTQALTRRGLTETHFIALARLLAQALSPNVDTKAVRGEVLGVLADFPLFPLHFSFDGSYEEEAIGLLSEMLR